MLPKHPHITKHTHTHTSQKKLKQPQYKIHTKWRFSWFSAETCRPCRSWQL